MVIFRVASTDFTVPVERETDFVELLAVAVDIVDGSDGRMLSGLDSILLGMVNWCAELGTVLANDEVVDGVSERGGFPVIQKKMRQWCLRAAVGNTFTFRTFLSTVEVSVYFRFLCRSG